VSAGQQTLWSTVFRGEKHVVLAGNTWRKRLGRGSEGRALREGSLRGRLVGNAWREGLGAGFGAEGFEGKLWGKAWLERL
jgi:hypothetical protein